jgi:hypothetical protein
MPPPSPRPMPPGGTCRRRRLHLRRGLRFVPPHRPLCSVRLWWEVSFFLHQHCSLFLSHIGTPWIFAVV